MTGKPDQQYQLHVPISQMRVAPDHDAECSNECLFGERVSLISPEAKHTHNNVHTGQTSCADEQHSDWVHVITQRDRYSGYVDTNHLHAITNDSGRPTHWVCSRSTVVFSTASIKSRVLHRLPFLSKVTSHDTAHPPFVELVTGGFVWDQHVSTIDTTIGVAPLQLALSHFLGAPYLWGGCTPEGVDCSGLVQALARAHGIDIPRDSGDQENALSDNVEIGTQQSQDIVYWPGHTGILVDPDTLLHATAHSLSCVIEPLDEVVERAGRISSIKRLFPS